MENYYDTQKVLDKLLFVFWKSDVDANQDWKSLLEYK